MISLLPGLTAAPSPPVTEPTAGVVNDSTASPFAAALAAMMTQPATDTLDAATEATLPDGATDPEGVVASTDNAAGSVLLDESPLNSAPGEALPEPGGPTVSIEGTQMLQASLPTVTPSTISATSTPQSERAVTGIESVVTRPATESQVPTHDPALPPASDLRDPAIEMEAPAPATTAAPTADTSAAASDHLRAGDLRNHQSQQIASHIEAVETTVSSTSAPTATTSPQSTTRLDPPTIARIEAAIDQLEHAPPPRTLIIDLGDQAGLRIRMSSTAGGLQLDVTADDGSSAAAWEQDLREHLARRGFDLGRDGRRQHPSDPVAETPDLPRQPASDDAVRL